MRALRSPLLSLFPFARAVSANNAVCGAQRTSRVQPRNEVSLVCDFAAKLGLWTGPCLRKEQSSLPHGLNIPIYLRWVLFIAQNGAQEAAQRGRDRVFHQLDTAAVQRGPRTDLCPMSEQVRLPQNLKNSIIPNLRVSFLTI